MPQSAKTPLATFRPTIRSSPVLLLTSIAFFVLALKNVFSDGHNPATAITSLVLALAAISPSAWKVITNRYRIYPDRIEWRRGLIAIDETSMPIDKIITIEAKQSIIGRLLHFGNIEFSSAAQNDPDIVFIDVGMPREIAAATRELIENHKTAPDNSGV